MFIHWQKQMKLNSLYSNIAEEWDFSKRKSVGLFECISLMFPFHSLLGRGSSVMLEIRVTLSILFIHNPVMFSDSSKGPQAAVSWVWASIERHMGFSQAVVFLSELLVLAIFLLL